MKLPVLSAVALSLCSLAASPVHAQENPPPPPPPAPAAGGGFGSQGQLVISTDVPLSFTQPVLSLVHTSVSMGGGSTTSYGIEPSLDYFIAPNVSLGGAIGVGHNEASFDGLGASASTTIIEVAARVGYNVVLTDTLSLWPRLGFSYDHLNIGSSGGGPDTSASTLNLIIFAPLLWHPAQHFFVGAGPVLLTQLIAKYAGNDTGKATEIGLEGILGGYFNP